MSYNRLNYLLVIAVESNEILIINLNEVLDFFSTMKNRRYSL